MSGKYNLNDNVNDYFEFEVGGYTYKMLYPTMEQVEKLQALITESEEKKASGEKTDDQAITEWMYDFITPLDADSPSISEIMGKQNIRVMRNFNTMFITEFSVKGD